MSVKLRKELFHLGNLWKVANDGFKACEVLGRIAVYLLEPSIDPKLHSCLLCWHGLWIPEGPKAHQNVFEQKVERVLDLFYIVAQ